MGFHLFNSRKTFIIFCILAMSVMGYSQPISLVRGDSLRWKVADHPDWQYGRLIDLRNDTLFVRHKGKVFAVQMKNIQEIEVAKGWKRNILKEAGYSALIGGGAFGLLLAWANRGTSYSPGPALVVGFTLGGIPFAVIGGIIGIFSHSVIWKKVTPENSGKIAALTSKPEIVKKDSSQTKAKVSLPEHQKVRQGTTLSVTNPQPQEHVQSLKDKLKKRRNLEFSVLLLWSRSGANFAIENQMRNSGFGDEQRGLFGTVTYPHSDPVFGFIASVKMHLKQKIAIGLQGGHLGLSKVHGYNNQSDSYLTLGSEALLINPMLYLKPGTFSQIGFGPAYYSTTISQQAPTSFTKNQSKNLWGFTGEFSLIFPQTTNLFVSLKLQYRYISPTTIGPFMTLEEENRATFPKMKVNYSMFLLGLGVGLGD